MKSAGSAPEAGKPRGGRGDAIDELPDPLVRCIGPLLRDQPLERLDAGEPHPSVRRRDRGQDGVDGLLVAGTGAAAWEPELEQHRERPVRPDRCHPCHRFGGVDERPQLERRVGVLPREPGPFGLADDLVRQDDARHAEPPVHLELLDGRGGDPPRAGRQLTVEQLRRHGRLAVRSEQRAGLRHRTVPSPPRCARRLIV